MSCVQVPDPLPRGSGTCDVFVLRVRAPRPLGYVDTIPGPLLDSRLLAVWTVRKRPKLPAEDRRATGAGPARGRWHPQMALLYSLVLAARSVRKAPGLTSYTLDDLPGPERPPKTRRLGFLSATDRALTIEEW